MEVFLGKKGALFEPARGRVESHGEVDVARKHARVQRACLNEEQCSDEPEVQKNYHKRWQHVAPHPARLVAPKQHGGDKDEKPREEI